MGALTIFKRYWISHELLDHAPMHDVTCKHYVIQHNPRFAIGARTAWPCHHENAVLHWLYT